MSSNPPDVTTYTADVSICSQICRLAVQEHGLQAKDVNVDIEYAMDNYEPWFVRMQPTMTVPVLSYDQTIVGDSRDIMHFLAEKHAERALYRSEERTAIDRYIDGFYDRFGSIGAFTFGNLATRGEGMRQFIKRGKGDVAQAKLETLAQDPEFKEVAEAKLAKLKRIDFLAWAESQDLGSLDDTMSELIVQMEDALRDGRPFLMGDRYSLADVVGTAYCARLHFVKGPVLFTAGVNAYYERMKTRPSFAAANVCSHWDDALMSTQYAEFVEREGLA
ncbi:MAG: glutathione S-transferase family protein [Myxococcota bacterium]